MIILHRYDLEELISDNKKLKKLSEDELLELGKSYPYSSIVDVLINKNHFLNSNSISLTQIVNLVNKTDNPGLAFTSILESEKKKKEKKKRKKGKRVKDKKNNNVIASDSIESKKEKKKHKKKKVKEVEVDGLNYGIASEQLAAIYLKQGMKKEAIEMYKRLSLQNPEKSAYFAKILKKLNKK